MKFFAVERNAAFLLMVLAAAGLILANAQFGAEFTDFTNAPIRLFDVAVLSPNAFTGEFLMTGFFLLVGLELKRELNTGVFSQRRALLVPTLAALFGAFVPAAVYFAINFNSPETKGGWGIPMATDLTFALAVYSIFAKKLPAQGRVFVLAFAVIDDLIAIAVIAIFVSETVDPYWVLGAIAVLAIYWLFGRIGMFWLMPLLGIFAWWVLFQSGVQPAVVGVLLGLLVPTKKVAVVERIVHPWVSLLILPIFALFATAVHIGGGFSLLTPVAIAVLLRPVGKIVGINLGVWFAGKLSPVKTFEELRSKDFLALSTLGGIGFSVALLIANQTFGSGSPMATQAIVATLLALAVSVVLAGFALSRNRT